MRCGRCTSGLNSYRRTKPFFVGLRPSEERADLLVVIIEIAFFVRESGFGAEKCGLGPLAPRAERFLVAAWSTPWDALNGPPKGPEDRPDC